MSPFERSFTTKLKGLRILEEIHSGLPENQKKYWRVLPHRVYRRPKEFDLRHFPNAARLIVRSDPAHEGRQSFNDWFGMPRLNIEIERGKKREAEEKIKAFMQRTREKISEPRFIVHSVPRLDEYDKAIQVNVDLDERRIYFYVGEAKTDKFRDEERREYFYEYDPYSGRIKREVGQSALEISEPLLGNILHAVQRVSDKAVELGETNFELNCVTYKPTQEEPNRHHIPEFYDLIFGKGKLAAPLSDLRRPKQS